MEWNNLSTQVKGDITELRITCALTMAGYIVSKPITQNSRYDLIFEANDGFFKVQCKHGLYMPEKGIINITVQSINNLTLERQSYIGQIDYFGIYCSSLDQCYLVPIPENVCGIYLRVKPTKNGQTAGIRWAKDFEI